MLVITVDSFKRAAAEYGTFLQQDIIRALLSSGFVANVKAHLIKEMDNHLQEAASLGDEGSLTHRGVTWRGFATWLVSKYGGTVLEGSRFRMRKARRDRAFLGPFSRQKLYNRQDDVFRGTLGMKGRARKEWLGQAVEDRPYEKVWRHRASGALYDETSRMLQDNGAFKQSLVGMRVEVSDGVVIFRPGPGVDYFDRQNDMRPIFVWDLDTDEPVLLGFFIDELSKLAREYGVVAE